MMNHDIPLSPEQVQILTGVLAQLEKQRQVVSKSVRTKPTREEAAASLDEFFLVPLMRFGVKIEEDRVPVSKGVDDDPNRIFESLDFFRGIAVSEEVTKRANIEDPNPENKCLESIFPFQSREDE